MRLIETPKSNIDKLSGNDIWLLDSGASYHVTGSENLVHDDYSIDPIPVELRDGTQTLATKKGLVTLNSKLFLQDVLYVPNLRCSLISIAQFINDIYYTVTFTPQLCMIQDLTMKNLIGVAELRKGVYFFKSEATNRVQVNKVTTYELWHRRLEHPSHQALFSLSISPYHCNL